MCVGRSLFSKFQPFLRGLGNAQYSINVVYLMHDYKHILFIEALENYVIIHTSSKKYMSYLTFKAVEENLPATLFLKVHKSYIVQLSKISSIEGNGIVIGQHAIPISRQNKDEIMQKILSGRFLKR